MRGCPDVNNDFIALNEQSRGMVGKLQGSAGIAMLSRKRLHDRRNVDPSKSVRCCDPEVPANYALAVSQRLGKRMYGIADDNAVRSDQ
jgi:hypothetical protein